MMEKENLIGGVVSGIFISLLIGIVVSVILRPAFGSVVFILSLALLPGFFISSLMHLHKLGQEKIEKAAGDEKFDWGVEVNLRRVQILYSKYTSMLQTTGILAGISFLGMVYLAKDFPVWGTGHLIFFPISTIMFITFLHLAFRWWFIMRSDYSYLRISSGKRKK